ncbi:MAG: chitinase [Lachnospiraceae bacterium]|nr:chitinase [Lachnospiraceae bacterium]
MKKKIIVIIIALIAIGLIGYFGVGRNLYEKYSYGTEKADLDEFFGVTGDELQVIHGNERIAERALLKDGNCYYRLSTVDEVIGQGFYFDGEYNGGTLMYTSAEGTVESVLDSHSYGLDGTGENLGHATCFMKNGTVYVAADYVSLFFKCSTQLFDRHVLLLTEWEEHDSMEVTSDTQIRTLGGIKSPILREVEKGERVELIEAMEEWSKVMTSDAYIGYIENKRMKNMGPAVYEQAPDPAVPVTSPITMDSRVVLGFHSIAGTVGNDTIYSMIEEGAGMNVIAPTWFSLNDNNGGIRNFGTGSYISTAHNAGIDVWAVVDDFNYRNDSGDTSVSTYEVLSQTTSRRTLERNLINACTDLGVDGLNIDFERLDQECGPHFAQFIKELSVLTHNAGIVLSIDNYVPFDYNEHFRMDVQGSFADYVLIMGYDEHYHGSGNIGSVASFDYVCYGMDKTMENVPAERIINAVPFYTTVWKKDGGTVTDSYLTLINQAEYISKYNIQYTWDEETCQNYAQWQSGSAMYYVWFEDSESISAKLNAMNSRNIGGVGVWRIGYGTKEVWNLISMYKEMGK